MVRRKNNKRPKPEDETPAEDAPAPVSEQQEESTSTAQEGDEDTAPVVDPVPVVDPATSTPLGAFVSDGRYRNKQRCLVLSNRGVTARYRHLLEDLRTLIPHHKKESKLDFDKKDGGHGSAVNEIAEVRGCNSAVFLESRKRGRDAFLWIGRTGGDPAGETENAAGVGPSVKFHLTNVHTMDELKMTGNCMKNSRPVLSFDSAFDEAAEGSSSHLSLIKHLLVDVFGTPRGHPKCKPFVDRVMAFNFADGKIWVRNYQIIEEQSQTAKEAKRHKKDTGHSHTTSLIEIGPRFVLDPVRVFRGSFGGQTLWENMAFVNPNLARAAEKRESGQAYEERKEWREKRKERRSQVVVPEDPLGDVFN